MNYELVADPEVEGNFFLKGSAGYSQKSFPLTLAKEIQSGMEVGYIEGGLAASLIGAKIAEEMVSAVVESNAREAINALDLIAKIARRGDIETIIQAVAATRPAYERYLASRSSEPGTAPKSNQE